MSDDHRQRFVLKLPTETHRELMAFAVARGEALSDILADWIKVRWEQQPEREIILGMLAKLNPKPGLATLVATEK